MDYSSITVVRNVTGCGITEGKRGKQGTLAKLKRGEKRCWWGKKGKVGQKYKKELTR